MIGMSFGRIRKGRSPYMQVRTADTTDGYPDENLLFSGHWLLAIDQLQGKTGFFE
jgi:hypothetical protein